MQMTLNGFTYKIWQNWKTLFCFEQLYKWNIESLMSVVFNFQLSISIMEVLFDCQSYIQSHLNTFHATFYLTFVVNRLKMCSAYKHLHIPSMKWDKIEIRFVFLANASMSDCIVCLSLCLYYINYVSSNSLHLYFIRNNEIRQFNNNEPTNWSFSLSPL